MPNKYCRDLAELRIQEAHMLKEVGDQWRTPENIFWGINAMFGPLVLDLFTDGENSKCEAYYTAEDNALTQDWSERLEELNGAAFGNPPYSRASQHEEQYITGMRYIMQHASAMREKGGRYVFLIKAATSEVWWPEDADHIAFIRGRIGFDLPTWFVPKDEKQVPTGAFFAGAVAVFDKSWRGPAMSYISRKDLEARGDAFLAQIRREAERLAGLLSPQKEPKNIPEIIPGPAALPSPAVPEASHDLIEIEQELVDKSSTSIDEALPLSSKDILEQSGIEAWACVRAAFGFKPEYTFSESKFAHTWAADSLEKPEIIAVTTDVIDRAKKLVNEHHIAVAVAELVNKQQPDNEELRADLEDRLKCAASEATASGMTTEEFIQAMESLDKARWFNIREVRGCIAKSLKRKQAKMEKAA